MLFNSLHFAIFLPIVFIIYWILPNKYRWPLLLAASYYFYMSWNIKYVFLILFTTGVSYFAAIALEKTESPQQKKAILLSSIAACLGVLFIFKYFNFFFESLSNLLGIISIPLHPITLKLLLPVGISFYTFQSLSYVVDVYRGEIVAEHHFGIYATFVSFFPQLVAGPIERTNNLLPQIKAEHKFDYERAMYGLKLMLWGYFKKIVIADNIAVYVDKVYNDLAVSNGFALIIATVFFTLQIYCDFSGYSDIARGTARVLDIELMQNFQSPYFASSVKEFWSRWHISLSTWFRDYVYIPMGGNRVGKIKHYWNLLVTFLVSGLWHGANWTFVIWGAVHGIAQIVENALGIKPAKKHGILWLLRVLIVFLFVSSAWTFFRAQIIADAIYVFAHMFDGMASPVNYLRQGFEIIGLTKEHLAFCVVFYFVPLIIIDSLGISVNNDGISVIETWKTPIRWLIYIAIGLIVVFFSQKGVAAEFVYFQF